MLTNFVPHFLLLLEVLNCRLYVFVYEVTHATKDW